MDWIAGRKEVLRIEAETETTGVVHRVGHHSELLEGTADGVARSCGVLEEDCRRATGGLERARNPRTDPRDRALKRVAL